MPRIIGVDIPKEKRMEIALGYIYGIGRTTSNRILKSANINPDKRARMCAGECGWYRFSYEFSEDPSHEVCDECFDRYVDYLDSVVDHR